MDGETEDSFGNASTLDVAADNFLEIFRSQEEQSAVEEVDCSQNSKNRLTFLVRKLNNKSLSLETQIEALKSVIQSLESQKSEIDGDMTKLRLRNIAYQKEHSNLRNSITVVKFQIEKIKESISRAKATDLKNLEDFEKAVDEITEKFRSGPKIYDRKVLMENIQKEKEKKSVLMEKLNEVRSLYETFCREKGLRVRKDEKEELLNCILPGSELFYLIEMTKTLDDVICGIKKLTQV